MPEKQKKAPDEVIVPQIEGIDSVAGLKRVAGNKRLYRDLLGQFAEKQGDAAAQISNALESGDRALAERIAHTVKGVAGNIGMTKIQFAAAGLEKAVRENDPAIPACWQSLPCCCVIRCRQSPKACSRPNRRLPIRTRMRNSTWKRLRPRPLGSRLCSRPATVMRKMPFRACRTCHRRAGRQGIAEFSRCRHPRL